MPTQSLFSTQIYRAPVMKANSKLHRDLLEEAYLLREKDQTGKSWSKENYVRGFTSYGSLDELHEFSSTFGELKSKLDPHVKKYISSLGMRVSPRQIRLTKMWVNVMGQGCTHAFHLHPLSVVSGSYYVQMPKGCSAIKFEDPRIGLFMSRPPTKTNPFQSLKPQAGDVVLFESWLKHEVPPHEAELERVSISFNYDWVGA